MAEGHAAVHAATCLQFAIAGVERLLYLAKVVDSIVNRTVSRLLAVYSEKRSLTPDPSPIGEGSDNTCSHILVYYIFHDFLSFIFCFKVYLLPSPFGEGLGVRL
jgi:hypothetical protein